MDIRVEKTESAIKGAFLELREHKPLEKIKVKELCDLARINKSTFYAHYQDIYALADALEEELIDGILGGLSAVCVTDYWDRLDQLTSELFCAFRENEPLTQVLFSGRGQNQLANRIEAGLRERIDREDPSYSRDPVKCIILSFCVQGAYHAFMSHSATIDPELLVATLGEMAQAVKGAYREQG